MEEFLHEIGGIVMRGKGLLLREWIVEREGKGSGKVGDKEGGN